MSTVLIVDDEPGMVELIADLLEDEQIDVLRAYDGLEALSLVREHHPDVMVADVMMPRMWGTELCRRVKSDDATSATRVILVSAAHWADPVEVPADELLPKPFDIGVLRATVGRML